MKMISSMPLKPEQLEQVKSVRPDLEVEMVKAFTEPDDKVEAMLTYGWDVKEETLDLYPNLKWIQGMSAGVDPLPLAKIAERGILLTNVRGAHAIQMAEHVIWNILNLLRQGRQIMHQQDQKVWNPRVKIEEIYGKTVCIVGAGAIGKAVAEKCRAFDMKVLGISRSGKSAPEFDEAGSLDELPNFLAVSDIVVVLLPKTEETVAFFNAERFNQMKEGSYFVNAARGPVVDEDAMLEALNSGRIQAAALDVFVNEPLAEDSPFWEMENVFITPHIGGRSPGYTKRMFGVLLKNLEAYPNQDQMINEINLLMGY